MAEYPNLTLLINLAKKSLNATEIWLYGSRARGDHNKSSDWDILVVLPDDAPPEHEDLMTLYELARDAKLSADITSVRVSYARPASEVVNTLMYPISREGLRLGL